MTVAIKNAKTVKLQELAKKICRNWQTFGNGFAESLGFIIIIIFFYCWSHSRRFQAKSKGPICPIWPEYLSKYSCVVSIRLVYWFAANSHDRNITNSCRDELLH